MSSPRDGLRFTSPALGDLTVPRNINAIALACRFAFAKRVSILTQIADGELLRNATVVTKTGQVIQIEIEPSIRERMEAVKILAEFGAIKDHHPTAEVLPAELQDLLPPEGSEPLLLAGAPSEPTPDHGSAPTDAFARVLARLEEAASVLSQGNGAAPPVVSDGPP